MAGRYRYNGLAASDTTMPASEADSFNFFVSMDDFIAILGF